MLRTFELAAIALAIAATCNAQIDDAKQPPAPTVEQLIQSGLEARRGGKNSEAIRLLQAAIAKIQAETAGDLASFLPAAMKDWTHDDEKPTSGTWNTDGQSFHWSQAKRTYQRESDGASVTVTISSWPQMIEGQRAMLEMFSNPQMLAIMNADPNRKVTGVEKGSFRGWQTIAKGESAQVTALGQSLMVMVECNQDDPKILEHYVSGIDFDKLSPVDAQAAKK